MIKPSKYKEKSDALQWFIVIYKGDTFIYKTIHVYTLVVW